MHYSLGHALLALGEPDADAQLYDLYAAGALGVVVRSMEALRKRLAEEGLEPALK